MPYHSAQRSMRSAGTSESASIIAPRTAVEVFDEEDQQWYKGGHVAYFNPENNQYTILWGNAEATTAEALYVRKLQVEWTRVRHPSNFRLDAKKAPYKDWLETQPPPPVAPERPEEPLEADRGSQVSMEPWVTPSKRPGAFPEFDEPLEPPPRKTPLWEKNIRKYFRKQNKIAEERPRFTVPARRKDWASWKTQMPELPPKKENLKIKKYWGRFAPEEAFAADEPQQETQPRAQAAHNQAEAAKSPAKAKKPAAAAKKATPAKKPAEEELVVEEVEMPAEPPAPQYEEAVAEERRQSATPESHATPEAHTTPAPGAVRPTSPIASPLGIPQICSTSPVPTIAPASSRDRLPISDASADQRRELFDQLLDEHASRVTPAALSEKLLPLLGIDAQYAAGVTPARLSAKSVSKIDETEDLNRTEFRTFLVSFDRYIALHDLYGNTEEKPEIEPEEFEKAIPLLSKWGVEMADVEKQFVVDTESSITTADFLSWAIQQGITESAEP